MKTEKEKKALEIYHKYHNEMVRIQFVKSMLTILNEKGPISTKQIDDLVGVLEESLPKINEKVKDMYNLIND